MVIVEDFGAVWMTAEKRVMRKRLWNVLGSVAVMLLMVLFVPGNVKAAEMVDGRVIAPFAGAMVTSANGIEKDVESSL